MHADHPQTLISYRRRVAAERQSLSPTHKDVDLRVLQKADGIAFNIAIDDILTGADAEGRNPSKIPLGYLVERTETQAVTSTPSSMEAR